MDVELIIDDVPVTATDGASVLDAARRAGRDVPALCHHEAVPAIASCRLCLVEIRGRAATGCSSRPRATTPSRPGWSW